MDSSGVKSKISLSFKCSKLLDLDVVSKSDPQVFVELKNGESNFQLIGKTEIVKNNLNPQFTKTVEIPFNFECYQVLKCSVYDIDEKKKEFIGSVTCTIGELYRSPNSTLKKTLLNNALKGYDCGKIEIRAEELANNNDELILNCSASQLDKKDLFGKSDGFLVFYKENKDGSWTAVHKTEVVMNTLNPVWRQQVIPVRVLCNGDFLRKIKVTCFDWNKSGVEDFIGSFETSLSELLRRRNFTLINKKKAKKSHYKHSGSVDIEGKLIKGHTYLDYIRGGMEVNLNVAVDFTSSNGPFNDPKSLHFLGHNGSLNPYQVALLSIAQVLNDWDSDGLYTAYGFGAKLPDGNVSHCFAMTGDPLRPSVLACQVCGIQALMEAYVNTVRNVEFWGPTNFAQIIRTVSSLASQGAPGSKYTILLILTDGEISDMEETCDEIVKASDLPIVIIGLGNACFDKMKVLDADISPLISRRYGRAKRDIVQFVNFNDVRRRGRDITSATLEEIPDQVVTYFKMHHIPPAIRNF